MKDFQQNLNNSGQIELTTDGAVIEAKAVTDWFFHPNGQLRLSIVPSLFIETDVQVVSIIALVSVEFVGSYDAGALFVQTDQDHWAKLAYEFSPQAIPTVVSVVTKGVSDDCDGPRVPAGQVRLRVYVDGNIVNFHSRRMEPSGASIELSRCRKALIGRSSWVSPHKPLLAMEAARLSAMSGLPMM